MAENKTGRASDDLPNIIVVQLESYFDVDEAVFFTTSEDACPICMRCTRIILPDISKLPSVGTRTANTEFEVLTGMNMRFFGPGEYPIKQLSRTSHAKSAATALSSTGIWYSWTAQQTEVTSTVVQSL